MMSIFNVGTKVKIVFSGPCDERLIDVVASLDGDGECVFINSQGFTLSLKLVSSICNNNQVFKCDHGDSRLLSRGHDENLYMCNICGSHFGKID